MSSPVIAAITLVRNTIGEQASLIVEQNRQLEENAAEIDRLTQRAESVESDLRHNARNHSFQAKSSEDIIVALHAENGRLTAQVGRLQLCVNVLNDHDHTLIPMIVPDALLDGDLDPLEREKTP